MGLGTIHKEAKSAELTPTTPIQQDFQRAVEWIAKLDIPILGAHGELSMHAVEPSLRVLLECAGLRIRKSEDYQNPNSNVTQSMHYRRGVDTIHDMIAQKLIRAQSILESKDIPNNESLEDTYKDIINYCSFAVVYARGVMQGQDQSRDMFNNQQNSIGKEFE